MIKVKIDKKALVSAAKEAKPEKANVTFRLTTDLYERFQKVCKSEDVKPTAIIEQFLTEFVKAK